MYIHWGSFLGSDYIKTAERIDDQKATSAYWDISNDGQAAFKRNPIPYIKNMLKAKKYITRVTPYRENSITAVFDLEGIEDAIKELRETCRW